MKRHTVVILPEEDHEEHGKYGMVLATSHGDICVLTFKHERLVVFDDDTLLPVE